ncbi:hypothetical protein PM030_15605 [Halorubrum ezzemoulense]|uniref:hypothetical protein n=1 Tax=Halorubrum ezzemoulense TaxID=337243 RepID=UPI002330BB5E|nr:hypothetical protein [Halorubrum ezzemoulense]MDB2283296.1 hypothetical protein [Halorubrum ezzemoulense]
MYSLNRIRRGLKNPSLIGRELNRLVHRRLYTRQYNTAGVGIFEEEWDNLILLDACRYDLFEQYCTSFSGELQSRVSRGSNTVEFLLGNVRGRNLTDTVYVTGNPQYHRHKDILDSTFHDVVDIWHEGGWNEKMGTVLPETVTDHALEAAKVYPKKRLLIHYVQPHYPFVESNTSFDKGHLEQTGPDVNPNFWYRIMYGEIQPPAEQIWEMYAENLERALPSVRELVDRIAGRTVISSDHGNMIGDRSSPIPIREWGHPRGIYANELVRVPWFVIDGERRRIVPEEPSASVQTNSEVVSERLRQLGYAE